MSDTLYLTEGARCLIVVAGGNNIPNLWHQRLGHVSEKGWELKGQNRE